MCPKISVIFPVYNGEKYLSEAISSILNQTESDLEVIAVDDGSTDNSTNILKQWKKKDNRIKILYQQNQGVGMARTRALEIARGSWIAFCDCDDLLPKNAYKDLLMKNNNADVIVGNFSEIVDHGNSKFIYTSNLKSKTPFQIIFDVPCLWTKLIRHSFIKKNKLKFTNRKIGEDVVFLSELIAAHPRISYSRKCIYFHRIHFLDFYPSLTNQYTLEAFFQHIDCREKILEICKKIAPIESQNYVYHNMVPYLINFILNMDIKEEKELAFSIFKNHILSHNWTNDLLGCESVVGVNENVMKELNVTQYIQCLQKKPLRDRTLIQFQTGQIGFVYIYLYFKAWLLYKIHLIFKKRF